MKACPYWSFPTAFNGTRISPLSCRLFPFALVIEKHTCGACKNVYRKIQYLEIIPVLNFRAVDLPQLQLNSLGGLQGFSIFQNQATFMSVPMYKSLILSTPV